MTDTELLGRVLGILDPTAGRMHGLRRNGRWLVVLPRNREAFAHALALYQPQRTAARILVRAVDWLSRVGFQEAALARIDLKTAADRIHPNVPGVEPGSCGILMGSPEHHVRRAIASYRNEGRWEVAKIAFGAECAGILEREARVLLELSNLVPGVPGFCGLHHGRDVTLLRMPYLIGKSIAPGDLRAALDLLMSWNIGRPSMPINRFPEWRAIEATLAESATGRMKLEQLANEILVPVIRHGDFARWNLLRQRNGSLIAIDWEWGHSAGMPGLDLVHFFLQDARLVSRNEPTKAVEHVESLLADPDCRAYLDQTGWSGDLHLPIIASLAWKQGAGHQDNKVILSSALNCRPQ